MESATITIIFGIVFLLVVVVGGAWLQIFLSKKESKWAGLILPIITFGFSLVVFLGVLLLSVSRGTMTQIINGEIVEQTTAQIAGTSSIIVSAIYSFVIFNIPTGILLAIYAACRGKRSKQRALEKMSVQDLE